MLNKSIIKVYQCGGDKDFDHIVHKIAIMYSDGTTDFIENDLTKKVKDKVKAHIKTLINERKNN